MTRGAHVPSPAPRAGSRGSRGCPAARVRVAFPLAARASACPAPCPAPGPQQELGCVWGQPRLSSVPYCLPTPWPLHRGRSLPHGKQPRLEPVRCGEHTCCPTTSPWQSWGARGEGRPRPWRRQSTVAGAPEPVGAMWDVHVCAGSTSSHVPRGPAGAGSLAAVCWAPRAAWHQAQPHVPSRCPVPRTHVGDGTPGPVPQSRLTWCPGGAVSVLVPQEGQRGGGSRTAPFWHLRGSALAGAAQTGHERLSRPVLSGEPLGHSHSQAWLQGGGGDRSTLFSPCVPQMLSMCHPQRR